MSAHVVLIFINELRKRSNVRPHSAVSSESDCRFSDREFYPGPVPYFRGD